ncbi:MAG: exodeoxyribonuclease VII large subunit [Deltaproteobacteria bacterium]|nr:exodeoxyribonuclease VII large subunit [Deltaproteobacteria bacterium]
MNEKKNGNRTTMDLFAPSRRAAQTLAAEPLSVSELCRRIRGTLEKNYKQVRVRGEIADSTLARSGHLYFSLADDKASLPAVMFRAALSKSLMGTPGEGEKVECLGRLTLYEPRGRTQLVVDSMSPLGEGALAIKLARLKARLAEEGLFDPERKRPLPFLPRCIGVVTSPTGAAIRDILQVLGRRFPSVPVLVFPCLVQGEQAAEQIVLGLERLGQSGRCDVLIVGRGGGSAEDLWAFNEEPVVRAVATCPVPVISAVGHEVDLVLSDLAADLRAPTPSAAAELVVPDRAELSHDLRKRQEALWRASRLQLSEARRNLMTLTRRMRDPRLVLATQRQRLDEVLRRLQDATEKGLRQRRQALNEARVRLAAFEPRARLRADRQRLESLQKRLVRTWRNRSAHRQQEIQARQKTLGNLDPLAVLDRGYSLVQTQDGTLIRDAVELRPGQLLNLHFARGQARARVENDDKKE